MFTLRFPAWIAAAAILSLAGCSGGGNDVSSAVPQTAQPTGTLEIVHASQDAPDVNVRVAGLLVASNVGYKEARSISYEVGDYGVEVDGVVPGGNVTVIPAAGQPIPSVSIGEGERVSVVAAGDVASIGPIVLTDAAPDVAATDVRLRVLHAASNAPTVEVYVTAPGDPLAVPLGTFSFGETLTPDAVVVPAGTYQIRVAVPGTPSTVVYDTGAIDLPGGADLLVAAVANTATGGSPISLIASTGTAVLEFLDIGTPSDVRVVHASPNAPNVDVIANNDPVNRPVVDLPFGDATDYLSLAPGAINVKVVETGTDAPAVIDADLSLTQGVAYSVYAVDLAANIDALVLVDDIRRVATEARVRIVHASPAAGPVDLYVVPGGTGGNLQDVDPAFDGVPFLADTGYVSLAPGQYDVVVTGAGSKLPAIGPVTLTLDGNGIYTAAAIDQVGGGLPPTLLLLDDLAP
ncbi:MAG: DUF4397 domain-containing protein [Pseudomonadales bacterium]